MCYLLIKAILSDFEIVLLSISLKNNVFDSFKALEVSINGVFIFRVIPIPVLVYPTPLLKTPFLPAIVLLEGASKAQCKLITSTESSTSS